MIKKQYVKSRKIYKVTFLIPKEERPKGIEFKSVHIVGDFNNWSKTENPIKLNSKGIFRTTLEFKPGKNLHFRYLVNNELWVNEWEADGYEPNEFGGDNCILYLPEV